MQICYCTGKRHAVEEEWKRLVRICSKNYAFFSLDVSYAPRLPDPYFWWKSCVLYSRFYGISTLTNTALFITFNVQQQLHVYWFSTVNCWQDNLQNVANNFKNVSSTASAMYHLLVRETHCSIITSWQSDATSQTEQVLLVMSH